MFCFHNVKINKSLIFLTVSWSRLKNYKNHKALYVCLWSSNDLTLIYGCAEIHAEEVWPSPSFCNHKLRSLRFVSYFRLVIFCINYYRWFITEHKTNQLYYPIYCLVNNSHNALKNMLEKNCFPNMCDTVKFHPTPPHFHCCWYQWPHQPRGIMI